jgi:hypothetical protein
VTPAAGVVVVDTDVVSFLFRNDTRAGLYRPHLAGRVLTISFTTLGRTGPLGAGAQLERRAPAARPITEITTLLRATSVAPRLP